MTERNLKLQRGSVQPLIDLAVAEDIGTGDVTSDAVFTGQNRSSAKIIAKADGIFCGGDTALWVYDTIDKKVDVKILISDGTSIKRGDAAAEISGPTASLLAGERIALNFMQRMSGIATETARLLALIDNTAVKILDTRKTLPGYRLLDKYSVRQGGGTNHRMGLYDMVMIKDNHIAAAGSITAAVNAVRKLHGKKYLIEVETTSIKEVKEALMAAADIIMLDNMEPESVTEALKIIGSAAKSEISGNVIGERLAALAALGPDYISIGALTHSVMAFDLSMRFE
jgi:nicotinate-nucleotide pyrophosphorylase (carboxylating)